MALGNPDKVTSSLMGTLMIIKLFLSSKATFLYFVML